MYPPLLAYSLLERNSLDVVHHVGNHLGTLVTLGGVD